jgi:hypothetical protein
MIPPIISDWREQLLADPARLNDELIRLCNLRLEMGMSRDDATWAFLSAGLRISTQVLGADKAAALWRDVAKALKKAGDDEAAQAVLLKYL